MENKIPAWIKVIYKAYLKKKWNLSDCIICFDPQEDCVMCFDPQEKSAEKVFMAKRGGGYEEVLGDFTWRSVQEFIDARQT